YCRCVILLVGTDRPMFRTTRRALKSIANW
ncbi:unnamed protein product, partial [Allacma fusca]